MPVISISNNLHLRNSGHKAVWYVLNQLSFPTQAKIAIRKETRPIINIVEDDVRLALEDIFRTKTGESDQFPDLMLTNMAIKIQGLIA